ncbi:MAG: sensor histidine kinase [Cyclobacteriaceae bacterium]
MIRNTISFKLIRKIIVSFVLIILLIGVSYVSLTFYFTNKYFEETSQKLNAHIAKHLIDEKFQNESPFLGDGSVNKPLFGDIMHDMMAVNRSIEVYLLDTVGTVKYSVVLDHSDAASPTTQIDVQPIRDFLSCDGGRYILGDDPRDTNKQKIFSAAPFSIEGNDGYIYIILASKQFEEVTSSLIGSYFLRFGLGASIATILFSVLVGIIVIWYLTKNLRQIIFAVKRFKEGDLSSRILDPQNTDLSILSETYNEMADTIVANIDELKSVEALRRELIANVSHDLRTPLAIMQGYIETLQIKSKNLSEDQREKYLSIIQKSTEKLTQMVAQLFEYSKLEAKQIEPNKEPFQISELANDVYNKYQTLAEQKNIEIKLDAEDQLPVVFGDISLVERIIQNLMDNALKFTPQNGEVLIEIKSSAKDVLISVRDNGPGIPEAEQLHIFERFKRSSTSKDSASGAGLGLAIVKKIIELHESTINVISMPNQGTTFQFNLPAYSRLASVN